MNLALQSPIKEDLIHYVWKTKMFDFSQLTTTDGQPVQILQFGNHNHDAGPDFSNGVVAIDGTQWAGNIEMHVFSSDWDKHGHDVDPAYDNVILHVVYEHDAEALTSKERSIPTVELKDLIHRPVVSSYARLISTSKWIPCENVIGGVDPFVVEMWLHRLAAERLEVKAQLLKSYLEANTNDWEEAFYIFLARYLGMRVNTMPMEAVAQNLPLSLLSKNKNDLHKIEALLYGQAGMLQASAPEKDQYYQQLKNDFLFLQQKYRLRPLPVTAWKFSRMRPAGFPTIRIAQLAQMIYCNSQLFSQIISASCIDEIKSLFKVQPSEYWANHYRFFKSSVSKSKMVSDGFIDLIIVNVVAPTLYLYGNYTGDDQYIDKAVFYMEEIASENNKIIRNWKKLGLKPKSAAQSQALIHLKNNYCEKSRCMSCAIGCKIVS